MAKSRRSRKNFIPFSEAAPRIQDADLLLWRPHGGLIARIRGWVVAQLTRGEYCHASKAAWTDGVLQTIGTEEGRGGIEEPLEPLVKQHPGRIDVYETNPDSLARYDRAGSIAWTRRHVGEPYGWRATLRCALSRAIILRWLPWFAPSTDDEDNGTKPPNCSALCSMSDRIGGGVDPVRGLSDNATEPVNLARSPFYCYRFTLVPDSGKEGKP